MNDMVMIPREVSVRLQATHRMIRESRAASMWSLGVGDGSDIHQMDDDLAHIAAALDDGTDPEAKE